MSKEIDTSQLYHIFKALPDDTRCFYTDTFASLCYLHTQGETEAVAVKKLLKDLFRLINPDRSPEVTKVLNYVSSTLAGNEQKYAFATTARMEFKDLFVMKKTDHP